MPSFSTDLGLSALPEIDQNQYPQIYAEAVRIRNALTAIQSYLETLAGGAPGQVLTKATANDFAYGWA